MPDLTPEQKRLREEKFSRTQAERDRLVREAKALFEKSYTGHEVAPRGRDFKGSHEELSASSKARVQALQSRIRALEQILMEKDLASPPVIFKIASGTNGPAPAIEAFQQTYPKEIVTKPIEVSTQRKVVLEED